MRYGSSIISGFILLLTGIFATITYTQMTGLNEVQKTAFEFAILYMGILATVSFGALVTGLAEAKLNWANKPIILEPQFFLFFLITLVYLLALTYIPPLGSMGVYLPATIIAMVAAMLVLGIKPAHAALVSAGFAGLIYYVFTTFLHVPLP